MSDPLADQLVALRPATRADEGWAASERGAAALRAVLDTDIGPDRRRRRALIAGVGGIAVFVGGAAAVAAVHGRAPADRHVVLCNQSASLTADGSGLRVTGESPADAAAACAANWTRMYPGTPTPERFAVCVYPATSESAGGQVALPTGLGTTDEQVCKAAGAEPAS